MKQIFSKLWKRSKQPRKQRKYSFNAPMHIQRKFFTVRLSKDLTTKYGTRNITLRTGDKVKIVRSQYKGKEGKVEAIDLKKTRVLISGLERTKSDGSKSIYPLHPSNLIIQELNIEDKKRKKILERRSKVKK